MSQTRKITERDDVLSLESGLEALKSSPEFRGPVESLDGHDSNDHLALVYETREEQFAAAVPFVRQGLERDERCMYIADENSRAEVLDEFRDASVDVDAALDSGALTVHTKRDAYCRGDAFDPDEMISFLSDAIDAALEEYEALRVAGEMTWVFGDDPQMEDLVEYEGKLNRLLPDEDSIALCQYNRQRFPPAVIRDVVETHPHLIYDGAVCQNFYYTPPETFFDPENPECEVDRMMGTLLERTEAKTTLQRREQSLHEFYETTADTDLEFEEKVDALLELGRERFGLDVGFFSRVDGGAFEVLDAVGSHGLLQPGSTAQLSETYCRRTIGASEPVDVHDAVAAGWEDEAAYETYGLDAYIGITVTVGNDPYGTLCFADRSPRDRPFTDAERTFLELMGQWLSYELDREERERYLREQNEITASPDRSFEEKLQSLFELGCERFDLELGAMARVDLETDRFEIEYTSDEHEHFEPGFELPLSETYCTAATDSGGAASVSDPLEGGYEDITVHREFGLKAYLGTYVEVEGGANRTFFFVTSEERADEFSDEELSFHRLMGQWVKYELEQQGRERHQRTLYEIAADTDLSFDEKLQSLFELGCERFDLQLGGLARVDPETDHFEVEAVSGDHEHLVPGTQVALSETYCRVVDDAEAVGISDPVARGFEGTMAHDEFGVESYLGSRIQVDGDLDRSFFFVSTEPRDGGFSDEERTFHHLMGQWLGQELERKRREDRLAALNGLSRELMDTETAAEVGERVVDAAAETLDVPVAAVALYDDESGVLCRSATTDAATALLRETEPFAVGNIGWTVLVENERRRVTDPLHDRPGDPDDRSSDAHVPVTEMAVLPLGNHGVFVVGSTEFGGFSSAEFDFVETVGANVNAALNRTDRERQLHDREETLESQKDDLERLERINTIIRGIDQAMVSASTRAEIEAVVCRRVADDGPYDLAWIGRADSVTEEITPKERAGDEGSALPELVASDGAERYGPVRRAIRTREPQVVNDVLDDPPFEPWRQTAVDRGYHATVALPLVYEDTLFGVFTVYASQPGVFGELERTVLTELSDTIAYAINAVESKKALVSNEVTALEFTVDDADFGPVALAGETGCRFVHETTLPKTDGGLRNFFHTRGVPPDEIRAGSSSMAIADLDLVSERAESGEPVCLFEAELTDESLPAAVLEHGGTVHHVEAAGESATIVVDLPTDIDVREFVEMFQTKYAGAELVAKRTRERSAQTLSEFRATLTDDLTPRQQETLQTAYFGGYFEDPRESTGSEIGETMDISQPTFNNHLRAAQRKLYSRLFEDSVQP